MKITDTILNWNVESENDGEIVDTHIESPCGYYGGSLTMAEDTGAVTNYRDCGATELPVPRKVLQLAQDVEDRILSILDK